MYGFRMFISLNRDYLLSWFIFVMTMFRVFFVVRVKFIKIRRVPASSKLLTGFTDVNGTNNIFNIL